MLRLEQVRQQPHELVIATLPLTESRWMRTDSVDKVRKAPNLLEVASVVQEKPLGLGHAVGCVESYLDDDEDAVAVLLPDDLVLPGGVLEVMARTRQRRGGSTGSRHRA